MKAKISYAKARVAATYAAITAGVSYTKAVVSNVYSGTAEALLQYLADSTRFNESGFLFTQDYVDDTYFEEAGYIADDARSF